MKLRNANTQSLFIDFSACVKDCLLLVRLSVNLQLVRE